MRTLVTDEGQAFDLPTTYAERDEIGLGSHFRAIHRQVLVVARVRAEGAWCAYVVPVPGDNHDREWPLWRKESDKLPEDIARAVFAHQQFSKMPYAH